MDSTFIIIGCICIPVLILGIICAVKESKVTGLYKAFGVYGRISGYMATMCPVGIIAVIVGLIMGEIGAAEAAAGLVVSAIGGVCIWRAYRKCPEGLKKKCILSMFITGLGVATKISIFFVFSIWKFAALEERITDDGETVFIYGDDVYDKFGNKLGKSSLDRNTYVRYKK